MSNKTKTLVTDIDIQIASPERVVILVHPTRTGQKKANVSVAGLTRREFDALPGYVFSVTSATKPQWKKRISCAVTVYTEEPPIGNEAK